MIDLFDVPWPELQRADVERFLADADDESITWEAKGDGPKGLRPEHVRRAACGFANVLGGYLILGAVKADGRWTLQGVRERGELTVWIDQALRGLRPKPRHALSEVWRIDQERVAAVVWIDPVDEPPCMTADGAVYERVAGATEPVRDPALLARLFQRGEQARGRALKFADRAARDTVFSFASSPTSVALVLAMAPIGRRIDDIGSRLFTERFERKMDVALWEFFGEAQPTDMHVWSAQDSLMVGATFTGRAKTENGEVERWRRWVLRASWDGTVTVAVFFNAAAIQVRQVDPVLHRGWSLLPPLVEDLGGYGMAQLVHATLIQPFIGIRSQAPPEDSLYAKIDREAWIRRVVPLRAPEAAEVASIVREAHRAAGEHAREPPADGTP